MEDEIMIVVQTRTEAGKDVLYLIEAHKAIKNLWQEINNIDIIDYSVLPLPEKIVEGKFYEAMIASEVRFTSVGYIQVIDKDGKVIHTSQDRIV